MVAHTCTAIECYRFSLILNEDNLSPLSTLFREYDFNFQFFSDKNSTQFKSVQCTC